MIELGPGLVYTPDVKGAILLDVAHIIPALPATIVVDGVELERKTEFHWTVLVPRHIAGEDLPREGEIARRVGEFVSHHALQALALADEYYVCHKPNSEGDTQTTVVQKLIVSGVDELWRHLYTTEAIELESPFPHVTLYKSSNSPYGIGVNNSQDRSAYCELRPDIVDLLSL